MKGPVAVTGGTGFIGRALVARLLAAGWPVRALTRRSNLELDRAGVVAIHGSLEDEAALQRLIARAVAVVHCAGAVRASSAAAYRRVNAIGSAKLMAAAAGAAVPPRFLMLSSLAAREPTLSPYARSKHLGENEVRRAAGQRVQLCILRPPAVYGPGDRATLPIFRQLRRGLLLMPAVPQARFSMIYVSDLAELIVQLLKLPDWDPRPLEVDDGRQGGYCWPDLAEIAGRRLGRPVRTIAVPRPILWPAAAVAQAAGVALRRSPAVSLGKLRELFHADWVCRESAATQALARCTQRTTFESGFPRTMAWYERHQWL